MIYNWLFSFVTFLIWAVLPIVYHRMFCPCFCLLSRKNKIQWNLLFVQFWFQLRKIWSQKLSAVSSLNYGTQEKLHRKTMSVEGVTVSWSAFCHIFLHTLIAKYDVTDCCIFNSNFLHDLTILVSKWLYPSVTWKTGSEKTRTFNTIKETWMVKSFISHIEIFLRVMIILACGYKKIRYDLEE